MSSITYASYNVIIDRIRAFANGHLMINSFSHGPISLVDLPKDKMYPAMHVVPSEITIANGQRTYGFDVVFFDKPRAHEDEPEYQREVISDCIRLAEDLLNELMLGRTLFGSDVYVGSDNSIAPFIESYSQVVTGVTLSNIQLTVPNEWNACDIPANWSVGGSGSGGSGSGIGGVILRTNGTNNAVQNILDLVQGSNIVIEDLGDGRVRIRATGGGGGGADWGSIGGTLSDQTDLQAALDARATDTELSAEVNARISGDATNAAAITTEASTRASADATLQNNINTEASTRASADAGLQVAIDTLDSELSTETTARLAGDATNAADISTEATARSNADNALGASITSVASDLSTHEADTNNPHSVTKAQVGLSNVDNTSDANKPISDATQTALDAKQDELVSGTNIKTINGVSVLGSGGLVIAANATQAIRATSTGVTIAASSGDRYLTLTSFANTATENVASIAAESAMTFTKILVRTTSTQSATGSLVFTLRKNGVDTAIILTIAAGATANTFVANGSVAFAVGDLISIKVRNNATATSSNIVQMSNMYTA
jgi:hypothetical protein